jgi:ribonuclease Z
MWVRNSEELGLNEMRVIGCGTGMPPQNPSQAAACFLVELGNGDKFIFTLMIYLPHRRGGLSLTAKS